MTQNVTVIKELPNGNVLVSLVRPTACGGDCGSCKGCAAPSERVTVEAVNLAGAKTGDRVVVESRTRKVLGLAALVYLMPVVLFFLLYSVKPVFGGLGFAAGIGMLFPLNRYAGKNMLYTVVSLTKQGD